MEKQNSAHAQAYIGLGANLQRPQQQLESALEQLGQIAEITVQRCSSFYRSAPIGPQDQDDFINAVVEVHTSLVPLDLLQQCQHIENTHGRIRDGEHWGPRTLDLDLLLYRTISTVNTKNPQWLQLNNPELYLPHPEIQNRAFVVIPLLELKPDIEINTGTLLETLRTTLSHQTLQKLNNT